MYLRTTHNTLVDVNTLEHIHSHLNSLEYLQSLQSLCALLQKFNIHLSSHLRFISDVNRAALVDEHTNRFQPHQKNDLTELNSWGLGSAQSQQQPTSSTSNGQRTPVSGAIYKPSPSAGHHKPLATSQSFNPFQPATADNKSR